MENPTVKDPGIITYPPHNLACQAVSRCLAAAVLLLLTVLAVSPESLAQSSDDVRAGATDLGDITSLTGPRFPQGTLDGEGDQVDYYRFTLTAANRVGLGLRQQDADADMFLEDSDGNEIYDSTVSGTDNEVIAGTLLAGNVLRAGRVAGDGRKRVRVPLWSLGAGCWRADRPAGAAGHP